METAQPSVQHARFKAQTAVLAMAGVNVIWGAAFPLTKPALETIPPFTFALLRFVLATLLAAAVFAAFLILIQSLAFWLGIMSNLSALALNAMLTFGIYPITRFDNYAKLILFTLIPAALMGAVPAEFIRSFTWQTLAELLVGAIAFLLIAIAVFRLGLRRYESGSAIQVEV